MFRRNHIGCLAVFVAVGFCISSAAVLAETSSATATRTAPELIAPAPADDGSRPACKGARRYIDLLNGGGYLDIGGLYSEDVVFYGPQGKTLRGRAAVQELVTKTVGRVTPQVYSAGYFQDGNNCILEIVTKDAGQEGHAALTAVDHFTVNKDGLYGRFIMFMSPSAALPNGAAGNTMRGFLCGNSSDPAVLPTRSAPELIAPAPAADGSRPVCKAARRYIEFVNSGHPEKIGTLFSKDAALYGPHGEALHGRGEITELYAKQLATKPTDIYAASFMQDGNNCLTEVATRPKGSNEPFAVTAFNKFTVNKEGLVERFVTFSSPLASLSKRAAQEASGAMCASPQSGSAK